MAGPRIFPSNCCKITIMTANPTAAMGDVIKMMRIEGMAPDKGTKIWDHIGDPHNKTDQFGVGHTENAHKDKAEEPDDERVHRFSDEETAKDLHGFTTNADDSLCGTFFEDSVGCALQRSDGALPVVNQIDGDDDADDKIDDPLANRKTN